MHESTRDSLLLPFEDSSSTRRGFLQLVGFGIAGGALAGCSRGPTRYVIPALSLPEELVPGRGYWIASTCAGCEAGCGVLAKCRDGRPIKLEGSPDHPVSAGGLCPSGQASVLSLYDSHRFDGPLRTGVPVSWKQADSELTAAFEELRARGGRVRLLTGTIHSPSTRASMERFLAGFADGEHVMYDPLSASALLEAHALTHGARVLPRLRFDRARTIVSFDADFLSTWISPVEFTAGYTRGRKLEASSARMSKHFQLEACTSLTGCRADERVRVAPWETGAVLNALCDMLEQRSGSGKRLQGAAESAPHGALVGRMAAALWETRGESLVVAAANDLEIQVLVNYANHLLGNYGTTLDLERPSQQRLGDDRALAKLRAELEAGEVDAIVVQGVNPAYDLGAALPVRNAPLVVSCASIADETTALADWICPEPHFLEAWGDSEPYAGIYSLTQPTLPPLRSVRTLRESAARWTGDERTDRELLREHWRGQIFPRQRAEQDFDAFFDRALHDGHVELPPPARETRSLRADAIQPCAPREAPSAGALALVLYPKAGMLDGRNAHNPWLQELPDPVSKITWDNYACLSSATAERLDLSEGDLVRVAASAGGEAAAAVELPVHVQPGQHDGIVAVALGYGRAGTDRFTSVGPEWVQARATVEPGGVVGASVTCFTELPTSSGTARSFDALAVELEPLRGSVELAATQDHHSLAVPEHLAIEGHEVRGAVLATTFGEWLADPGAALHGHHEVRGDLWQEDHPLDVRWGMAIDLSACTGCSACVIGCQSENNVPVVGRDEVRRHREMSWLRIDRYFQGEGDELRTAHQPMMCQHCDHAPCESVCPVLATVHTAEGLNSQVYNRCVGTRYCANTCPYKVRRFNWFDYPREDQLQNHSLNPDVTVRTRGVMEKCSFCVQRIQEAKAEARAAGNALADGDIRPACQQSCPADAIVFGDLQDPASRVAQLASDPRAYSVLEELNVQPSVRYLAQVQNRDAQGPSPEGRHDDH